MYIIILISEHVKPKIPELEFFVILHKEGVYVL
nr:MAG TPA: hypothetical protein [Caudoviricetes sp.]